MNIWPWTLTNTCSLSEHFFLNRYNFPEWIYFHWTRIYFLKQTDKVSWHEYNFVSEYNCLEWLYFLWINICSLNEFQISLTVKKCIVSLKLNKYNSLKLHKYTVAGCKIMPWVQIYFVWFEYMYFLNFASFTNGHS